MENSPESPKLEVGQETLKNLNITRKWTMFLAVLGFIFLGLMLTLGLITGTFLSAFSLSNKTPGITDTLLLAGFFGMAVIYFFPIFFLYRFSKHTSIAVATLDSNELNKALKYLKRYFVYLGILLIGVITIYITGLIIAGTSIAFLKGL